MLGRVHDVLSRQVVCCCVLRCCWCCLGCMYAPMLPPQQGPLLVRTPLCLHTWACASDRDVGGPVIHDSQLHPYQEVCVSLVSVFQRQIA